MAKKVKKTKSDVQVKTATNPPEDKDRPKKP